jgi:hypothetical protein
MQHPYEQGQETRTSKFRQETLVLRIFTAITSIRREREVVRFREVIEPTRVPGTANCTRRGGISCARIC